MFQRKPVVRAFTGRLVGMPPDAPGDLPTPPVPPLPGPPIPFPIQSTHKKRGRPRLHENNAAKTAAHRERKSVQEENKKRRVLIQRILRSYRAQASKPCLDNRVIVQTAHANIKQWTRDLHKMLLTQPLDELRKLAEAHSENADGKGRLQGEVSGGRTSATPEKVDSAIQREALNGGTRVVLTGRGPDSYDKADKTVDHADSLILRRPKAGQDAVLHEQHLLTSYESLIVSNVCTVCNQSGAVEHVRKFYIAAVKAEHIWDALKQMPIVPERALCDIRKTMNDPHVIAVDHQMERLHREELAKGKKARRLQRLGRAAKREFLEERDLRQEEQSRAEGWT